MTIAANTANTEIIDIKKLKNLSLDSLKEQSNSLNIQINHPISKQELIFLILNKLLEEGGTILNEGVLEVLNEGFGFLRSIESNYVSTPYDIYISPNQIKKFGLRTGDTLSGSIRSPKQGERYFAFAKLTHTNFEPVENYTPRISFESLTPLYPVSKFNLEYSQSKKDLSTRVVDIVAPLGKGQRALIVAPPRTGKTVFLQNLAHAIIENNPEVYLIAVLIDERPEEVTDMKRSIKAEVVSSTFDEPARRHIQLAEIVIEKAKRLVESKRDVVILLDSITRLTRAYNTEAPPSNKVLSGGLGAEVMQQPKQFFGAARNIEQGGSLTIIATALIETGSRMDDIIYEEFKGTGNAEIVLDRKISERRIYPAIDINKSGTRKEELLLDKGVLTKTWLLRKMIQPLGPIESMEFLRSRVAESSSNEEFFETMTAVNSMQNKK